MHRLSCTDWRSAPEAQVVPLYDYAIQRWASILEWETASNWQEIERGRQLGTVSGLLVTDQHRHVVGWSYFITDGGTLHVGGLVSPSEACTALMLDRILCEEALASVNAVRFFVLDDAHGLVASLKARGFSVGRYWYLMRDASSRRQSLGEARRWRPEDAGATADLLKSAYASQDDLRPFATRGTSDEWREYVEQLVTSSGCGTLLAEASLCLSAGPGRLAAVALVSRIAPDTAHLVQLAVAPQFQGRGLASGLLDAATAAAARAGCLRLTLLVAGHNRTARRLYEGARFKACASFISAGLSPQPRRSTSVAPGASAMTLR